MRDPRTRLVFQSAQPQSSPYSADAPLEQVGPLTVHATIRPHAVELLALGAIPESRVPLLVGLLTLTAAMVVVTIMQLRREHELSRLRSDFISSVSHELRTPLSQILLFAETLNLGRVRTEEERHTATDVIVQEGRRLMHLVENILHFSRAERRMTRLGPEPLDLSQAVAAIVDDWLPLASAADVRVRTQFAPDVHAVADRSALRQMVLNLLDNAVKYGPATQTVTVGHVVVDAVGHARSRLGRRRGRRNSARASASACGSRSIDWIATRIRRSPGAASDCTSCVSSRVCTAATRGSKMHPAAARAFVIELPAAPRAPGSPTSIRRRSSAAPNGTLEPRP